MKKRILSMIICLAMVLALLPAAVFASGSKISIVTVNVPYSLADGEEMFFDNSLITVGDPALYRAYLWGDSWAGPEGIYMPHFKGGERYTLKVLIVPEDGATGLDSSTAPFLPVYINGMRARFNPAYSPWLEEAPDKTTYAYEIDLQCPYTNEIDIVEIFGFTPPTPGAVPCDINDLSVPENAPYYISGVTWERYLGVPPTSGAMDMAAGETFTDGVYYFLIVKLCPYDGYTFSAGDVTWRINGTSYNGYVDSYSLVSAPTEARLYSADLKAESRHIDYIDIEGLGAFYEGATARSAIENVTAPDAEGYTLFFDEDATISADSNNTYIYATDVFQSGETYRATFRARPDPGWTIDNETVWRINGSSDRIDYSMAASDYWFIKTVPTAPIKRTVLDRIDICGYNYPAIGQTAGNALTMYAAGDLYEIVDAYWFCDTDSIHMAKTDTFEEGKLYSACVAVKPCDPAFAFSSAVEFCLNGGSFPVGFGGVKPDGSCYIWTGTMEATAAATHTVSWYLDPADDFAVAGVEVEDGEVFGEPAAPAKDGYTFGGWFTDRACTVPYDPTAPIYADTDLFPLWIPAPVCTPITAVNAQVPEPVVGQKPAGKSDIVVTSTPSDADITIGDLLWFYWDESFEPDGKWIIIEDSDYVFEADKLYAIGLYLCTQDDYGFDEAIDGTVNGEPSDTAYGDVYSNQNEVYLAYEWTVSEQVIAYDIWVNGEQFTRDNLSVTCGSGTAVFDPAKDELTLNNATITKVNSGPSSAAVYSEKDLTVILKGDNTVSLASDVDGCGFYTSGADLTLTGDGDLDITINSDNTGLLAMLGGITINMDGDLTIDTVGTGINPYDSAGLTISGSGDVSVTSDRNSIYTPGDIILSGSGEVTFESGKDAVRIWYNYGSKLLLNGTGSPITITAGSGYKAVLNDEGESPVGGTNIDYYDEVIGNPGEQSVVYRHTQSDPCEGYTDINRDSWYHSAADFVIERGLMGSTKTDRLTFEPNTKVSRAMVASILYTMAGKPAASYKGTFTDVPTGKWFTNAIEWCAQNGLASGKGNGKFDPNGNVTRQELAVFMMQMAAYLGKDTSGRADLSGFADWAKVPAWSKTYVAWAVDAGLISGKASGDKTNLAPADNATRAELAVIIRNFVQNIAEAD